MPFFESFSRRSVHAAAQALRAASGRVRDALGGMTLSAKMMTFFAALVTAALGVVLFGSRVGIDSVAEQLVGREFAAQSRIFENVRDLSYDHMASSAALLASDYGFRSAVASGDAATIVSAMDSLKRRLDIASAMMISADGIVVGAHGRASAGDIKILVDAVNEGATRGLISIGGVPFRAVAAPINAPDTIGWIIFMARIDDRDIARLATLSAIPLRASVVPLRRLPPGVPIVSAGSATNVEQRLGGDRMLVQASRVPSFGRSEPSVLVLRYNLTRALDAYDPMIRVLLVSCLLALGMAVGGSYWIARKLARPIETLGHAVRRVGQGHYDQVEVVTGDEIGRLASAFNAMVVAIEDRGRQLAQTQNDARARLEAKIREVQDENRRLDGIAASQRDAAMADAANALDARLAPLLRAFDAEANRLFGAAFDMRTSLEGARSRATEAGQSALRAEQMTKSVASSVADLASASERIAGEARSTRELVHQTTTHSAAATTSFADLSGAVNGIGTVTSEIRSISDRTNILALNAAIEAARAGTAGVGFGVVAAEVKDLANQTARLTDMISTQLREVKQLTVDAHVLTQRVGDALSTAGTVTEAIASAARAQSDATGKISIGIVDIAADSVHAVEALDKIDSAALQSWRLADQVTGSAESVASRVKTLRETLDTFLLTLRRSA